MKITIDANVGLLRNQLNYLLTLPASSPEVDGVINMVESMLDVAEGYSQTKIPIMLTPAMEIKRRIQGEEIE